MCTVPTLLTKKANRRQSTIRIGTAEGRESYAQRMEELRRKRQEKTMRLKAEVDETQSRERLATLSFNFSFS